MPGFESGTCWSEVSAVTANNKDYHTDMFISRQPLSVNTVYKQVVG